MDEKKEGIWEGDYSIRHLVCVLARKPLPKIPFPGVAIGKTGQKGIR